ncbi:MAG: CDP-glycerol glycerophosphotransferase family protein [Deltaproteobacteria bacterium]|nr:CDP-glycerol glycerophosphotransferase family protein [Deltaproteobacteria bacterium]
MNHFFWKQRLKKFLKTKTDTLFLINIKGDFRPVAQCLQEVIITSSINHLIVLFNIRIPASLSDTPLNIKLSEDYLSEQDYIDIDDYVFKHLSISWHLYKDISLYQGMALGKMTEYEFQKYLTPRIKNLHVLKTCLESKPFKNIIVIEDTRELISIAQDYSKKRPHRFLGISLYQDHHYFKKIKSHLSQMLSAYLDTRTTNNLSKTKTNFKKRVAIDSRLQMSLQEKIPDIHMIPILLEKGFWMRLKGFISGRPSFSLYTSKKRTHSIKWLRYHELWKEVSIDTNFQKLFTYKNISLWNWLHPELRHFFLEVFPRIVSNVDLIKDLLIKNNINLIFLRNDHKEWERTLILVARTLHIPSLWMQHGILAESNGHHHLLASHFMAWGKASANWFENYGCSPSKITIVGNYKMDSMIHWKPKMSKNSLFEKLALDPSKRTILFAPQQINKFSSFWTDDLFYTKALDILSIIKKYPHVQCLIKADPQEDISPYIDLIKQVLPVAAAAIKQINIFDVLYYCDALITLDSTVALEAMIFHKPIITYNLTKRKDRVDYGGSGATFAAYTPEGLAVIMEKLMRGHLAASGLKRRQEIFLKNYMGEIDGSVHKRISSEILRLAT